MKRLALATVSAAVLAAPAFAQAGSMPDEADELVDTSLVSPAELEDATVYGPNGEEIGDVVDWEIRDGDIVSVLVHDFDRESVVLRRRIVGDDIEGFDDQTGRIIIAAGD